MQSRFSLNAFKVAKLLPKPQNVRGLTKLLLPLLSTGFYPDGNPPKETPWKIAENRTLKAGSSPPRA